MGVATGLYVTAVIVLGIWWSSPPTPFDVRENAQQMANLSGKAVVTGSTTTSALITVIDTLLNKPGGYTHNDIFPPGLIMDNMPSWEYGVLVQSRDLARALREVLSRSQSQSKEDEDLTRAEPRINFQPTASGYPRQKVSIRGTSVSDRPSEPPARTRSGGAQFFARADNLSHWLGMVERLGSLAQRLSASVGQRRLHRPRGDPWRRNPPKSSRSRRFERLGLRRIPRF